MGSLTGTYGRLDPTVSDNSWLPRVPAADT